MNIQAKLVAGLFLILAVLASYFATYKYGRHAEFIVQDNLRKTAVIKQQEENQRITLAYAKKLTEAMQNEELLQTVISNAEYRAGRMQVHFPGSPMPGTAETAADRDEASRLLSERLDALFGSLQARATDLFTECEEVNKQAIRNNSLH